MQTPASFPRSAPVFALLAGLLLAGQTAAQVRPIARPSTALQTAPSAAATAQIQIQPWATLDFEKLTLGQTRAMEVVVMSRSVPSGMPNLPNMGGSPEPLPQMMIQGGAAADYVLAGPLQTRAFQRVNSYGLPYKGWEWIATVQFRPSTAGVRKTALMLDWEDGRRSGRNLVGIGVAPASAVQMPRLGGVRGGLVSLVGNPNTLGVSILDIGKPKKVRMSPEPLSPNAAWETVFPIAGKSEQPVTYAKAVAGGSIVGANAADFALGPNIVFNQGAATRLITFSPRGSGLRTAEYSQLQFDGSTVTTVLEGYGK